VDHLFTDEVDHFPSDVDTTFIKNRERLLSQDDITVDGTMCNHRSGTDPNNVDTQHPNCGMPMTYRH